jgi:hypothetical protein
VVTGGALWHFAILFVAPIIKSTLVTSVENCYINRSSETFFKLKLADQKIKSKLPVGENYEGHQ